MTQRLGSNINSPIFMLDPLLTSSSSSPYNDDTFFVKGDLNTFIPSEAFSELGNNNVGPVNNDDLIIINNDTESFQLHRDTLRSSLQELKRDAHTPIARLNPQQTENFRSVSEALRLLYASQALYDIVLVDIRNIFGDVTNVKPGTVAAFFVGCFTDDKFPGPMGCSPKCASSLRPTEGTPGYDNCEDLVLIYSDGHFSSLNNKQSKHAYIYVGDDNFKGFSQMNIDQLKAAGIEKSSLIFGNADGSYREVTSALPVDNLPKSPVVTNPPAGNSSSNVNPSDTNQNNVNSAVVFGIIIFIIIVLLLVVLYQNRNRYW